MFTVVATQKLKAEDFLLRFKAEASQDDIHGIRSTSARPVLYILKTLLHMRFFSLVCRAFLLFFSLVHLLVCLCDNLCYFPFLTFAILYKVTTHACW